MTELLTRESSARKRTSTARRMRADIQGLRAFAVLVVIANHLFDWPRGGFVGVDVFFVLSGFLITSLLIEEHERTGHISFSGFYRRRIKRIIPASVLVLITTVVLARLMLGTGRAQSVTVDGIWALLFSANWRYASLSTDYFGAGAPESPLQHYWSLGVEEQFYFVWPWLMLAIFAIMALRSASRNAGRVVAFAVMLLLSTLSFVWALRESVVAPDIAYFSTLSRTWELGIGAMLAVAAPILRKVPATCRTLLAWSGLAAMVASLWVVTPDSTFPAPAAALPVLATGIVILAGTGVDELKAVPVLTNRVSGYVGDISYSLYLWHFPIIVLTFSQVEATTPRRLLVAVVVVVVSAYSYHLVEDPIRRSRWLVPKRRGERLHIGSPSRGWQYGALSFVALMCVFLVALALKPVQAPSAPPGVDRALRVEEQFRSSMSKEPAGVASWRRKVASALRATSWPTLSPNPDTLSINDVAPQWVDDRCLANSDAGDDLFSQTTQCVYGDPNSPHKAVLYGDSVAISYAPGLISALGSGWSVRILAAEQCPILDAPVTKSDGSPYPACADFRKQALDAINQIAPDLVVASSRLGNPVNADTAAVAAAVLRTARQVHASTQRVLVLGAPQTGSLFAKCKTARSAPSDCIRYVDRPGPWQSALREFAASTPGGRYADPNDWLCLGDAGCPAFVDGAPVLADSYHLTAAMAHKLAPLLRAELAAMAPRLFIS